MKNKNESLLLFFSSPEFHDRFNPKSSRNYYVLAHKYRKFCIKHGYEQNNEGFAKYYDLAKTMHGKQYDLRQQRKFKAWARVAREKAAKFETELELERRRQQRIKSLNIKSSRDINGDTIRGKSMWHDDFFQEVGEEITPSKRVLDARVREVKGNITGLDRRLLQMEGKLARCQAKIKDLELKLKKEQENKKGRSFSATAGSVKIYACSHDFEEFRCMIPIDHPDFSHCAFDSYRDFCKDIHEIPVNFQEFCRGMWPQEEKEQPIGKVSDYKESEEYKQALTENNCFFTYLLDKIKAIYNNYVEYCGKNNFKPVPFPEFKDQWWGDE